MIKERLVRKKMHGVAFVEKIRKESVVEVSGFVLGGVPGFASFGLSPKLVYSGQETNPKPKHFYAVPFVELQAYALNGGFLYFKDLEKPLAKFVGAGPLTLTVYNPLHKQPNIGLSIPLVGGVFVGPSYLGAAVQVPNPFVPGNFVGGGLYVSNPILAPVTGRLWRPLSRGSKAFTRLIESAKGNLGAKFSWKKKTHTEKD